MKRPPANVSDHAVLRYLERVQGFDVEEVRRQIAATCARGVELGALAVTSNGFRYTLRGDVVTTVMPKFEPDVRTGRWKVKERGDE